jgi:hypothetical protein
VCEDSASASPEPNVIVAEAVAIPPEGGAIESRPIDPGAVTQEVVTESAAAEAVVQELAAESAAAEAVVQEVATESAVPEILAKETADESSSAPDPAPIETEQCDGASVAGALMDLWKEAGVAPPLDVPEMEASTKAPPTAPEVNPTGYDALGVATTQPSHPVAPTRSYAARARAEEKVTPKKLVRVVGMMVSGLLAVLLTYGAFKLFGWGGRSQRGAPTGTREATAKPRGEAEGEFVPDWKGLKQFGGK